MSGSKKRILKKTMRALTAAMAAVCVLSAQSAAAISLIDISDVDVKIDLTKKTKAISPYIYGVTDQCGLDTVNASVYKQAGSRMSTYNWENNAYNEGMFDLSINVPFFQDGSVYASKPAGAVNKFIDDSADYDDIHRYAVLPINRYAANDASGVVSKADSAPSHRWAEVMCSKQYAYTSEPRTDDERVYADEYLTYIIKNFGGSSGNGISGYFLDNEPDRWATESPYSFMAKDLECNEFSQRSAEFAAMIKSVDPGAEVFGPSLADIKGCVSLSEKSDWNKYTSSYAWFIDYYLSAMSQAEKSNGRRVFDCLDIHYYPQASGTGFSHTAYSCANNTHTECNKARINSVRTLWDSSYNEKSWVSQNYMQYTPVLPMLQASIELYYPGTKLSVSEYDFGGGGHISGALAQIDALSAFANQGVYMASLNCTALKNDYRKSAINLFTDYDDEGSAMGDSLVYSSTSSDDCNTALATMDDKDTSTLKLLLSNKNTELEQNVNVEIVSDIYYTAAEVYGISSDSAQIKQLDSIKSIENNSFSVTLKPLTAVVLVFETNGEHTEIDTSTQTTPAQTEVTVSGDDSRDGSVTVHSDVTGDIITEPAVTGTAPPNNTGNNDEPDNPEDDDTDEPVKDINSAVKFIGAMLTAVVFCGVGYVLIIDHIKTGKK